MQEFPDPFFAIEKFVPSLRQSFAENPLDCEKIILAAIPIRDPNPEVLALPDGMDRRSLCLTDGNGFCFWEADSLQAMFRGSRQPPVLGDYPEAYNDSLALLDLHALDISKFFGDRRDVEMLEIYSALRRRPDGRSLGYIHDYMWQAAAFVLGTRPLSQAEFDAIVGRLEQSCRTFEVGPTSRNYIAALRTTLGCKRGPVWSPEHRLIPPRGDWPRRNKAK
jgi:hypothetical protein